MNNFIKKKIYYFLDFYVSDVSKEKKTQDKEVKMDKENIGLEANGELSTQKLYY